MRSSPRAAVVVVLTLLAWPSAQSRTTLPTSQTSQPVQTTPIDFALSMLAQASPDARVWLRATPVPGSDLVWIAGELPVSPGRADAWGKGAVAKLQILSGTASARSQVTIAAGQRTFLTSVTLPPGQAATVDVQARISPARGGATATEVSLAIAPQALLYRRATTARGRAMTADVRFTRTELVHLELPVTSSVKPGLGRLLDRSGLPLKVPVTMGERTDTATGQHWITADVVLAPLAPADYLIEVGLIEKAGGSRVVTGIRIVK